MGKTVLPAQDLYVGTNRIFKADGTAEVAAVVADNSVVAAKIAANAVETAKIKNAHVTADKLAANSVITAKILDANVTLAKLAPTAKTHFLNYQVENLAANADIVDRPIFEVPASMTATITSAVIISQGTAATIDSGNTCVIKLTDATNTIVEYTIDGDPAFPADGSSVSLGELSEAHKVLTAGEKLELSVTTTGTTADPPAFMLQITYTLADA